MRKVVNANSDILVAYGAHAPFKKLRDIGAVWR